MSELPRTPSFQLSGKKALVTGASRGIGLGGAMALAEHGAHVVMAARNAEEIQANIQAMELKLTEKEMARLDLRD